MSDVKFLDQSQTEERALVERIVKRYAVILKNARSIVVTDEERLERTMDIEACHCNGNPLDLQRFASAGDFDLIHDVLGIRDHLDRQTGKLKAFFSPRFSKHQEPVEPKPAPQPKVFNQEQQTLLKTLEKMQDKGWHVAAISDGEQYEPVKLGMTLRDVVEDASAVEMSWIQFKRAGLNKNHTILLVWGNDERGYELIADHSEGDGFDEALGEIQHELFPEG